MSTQTVTVSSLPALEEFARRRDEPQWMRAVRARAIEKLATLSWPSPRDEEFRRTDTTMYPFDDFDLSRLSVERGDRSRTYAEPVDGESGRMNFRSSALTSAALSPELRRQGVELLSVGDLLSGAGDERVTKRVEEVLLRAVENADNAIAVWHYATITHGAVIYVPRFVEVAQPFAVSFEQDPTDPLCVPKWWRSVRKERALR